MEPGPVAEQAAEGATSEPQEELVRSAPLDAATALPIANETGSNLADPRELHRQPNSSAQAVLQGRLLDMEAKPIPNAELLWTAWPKAGIGGQHAAGLFPDPAAVERLTVRTTSAKDGSFAFFEPPPFDSEETPNGEATSALWVLSNNHIAKGLSLSGIQPGPLGEIQLEQGEATRVLVLDAGASAAGAQLKLRPLHYPQPLEWDHVHPAWVLSLTQLAGESGRASFPQMPFPIHVAALRGKRCSAPYEGLPEEDITLELSPSFSVRGSLDVPPWNQDLGAPRIQILIREDDVQREVAALPLADDLTFGPMILPVLEAADYVARVEGGGVLPTETPFPAPTAGETVELALTAELGAMTWLAAYADPAEGFLPNATATVSWSQGGELLSATFNTNPDGYILASGLPHGTVNATLEAPGYTAARVLPFTVPEEPEPALHDVRLLLKRRLEGVCQNQGEPVPDFDLFYWWATDQAKHASASITGAAEGHFELLDAYPGKMGIFASSPALGASAAVFVNRDDTFVTLELQAFRSATGKVLDQQGNPVTAQVHLRTLNGTYPMEDFGATYSTGPDGHFRLNNLPPQDVQLIVEAAGFSNSTTLIDDRVSQTVDLGTIRMVRRQELLIHVATLDGARAQAGTLDGTTIPRQPLPPSGDLLIEHMDAGRFMFFVADDERWWTQWRTETLTPGEEWRLDFDFVGGETVQLQATPREGAQLPKERIWVSTTRAGLSGEVVQDTLYLDEDGAFTLQGLGPGQAVFSIEAQSAHETGIGSLEIVAGGGPYTLTIPIGPEDWHIKLLDSTGAAIGGASVYLYGPDVSTPYISRTTGPEGRADFPVLGPAYSQAAVRLADGGLALDIPISPSLDPKKPTLITASPRSHVHATLIESGVPQEGLTLVYASSAASSFPIQLPGLSDASGQVDVGPLPGGARTLRLLGPDLWEMTPTLEATSSGPPVAVEVYHLAQLELAFLHEDGSPAAGLPVDLVHQDLAESVSSWLEAGRAIQTSSTTLTTNAQGRLTLSAIPRGSYTWQVDGATGTVHTSAALTTIPIP